MRKLFSLALLLSCSALLGFSALAAETNAAAKGDVDSKFAALFGDPVVAKAKNFEIKQSQLDAEVARSKVAMANSGRTMPPNMDAQILDGMIALKLLLAQATEQDKKEGTEQFEKSFKDYKTAHNLTEEQFDERLLPHLKAQ